MARALGASGPPGLVSLRGPGATVEAYHDSAPAARLIHFACHAGFDEDAALLSFLQLTGSHGYTRQAPGCLYAYEIMEHPSSATLVTLASCHSGSSTVQAGDEQRGLVPAYLIAGAKSVLSAQRQVHSQASRELFSRFYQLARGKPLADALATAQRDLIRHPEFASPVYWSPFVLTGDGDTKLTTPTPAGA